jgi:hypothetical protein
MYDKYKFSKKKKNQGVQKIYFSFDGPNQVVVQSERGSKLSASHPATLGRRTEEQEEEALKAAIVPASFPSAELWSFYGLYFKHFEGIK